MNHKELIDKIFEIKTEEDFNRVSLLIFNYQYHNIKVYQEFINYLSINPSKINHYSEIPFLPIQFFKSKKIVDQQMNYTKDNYFISSGTTQKKELSKHYIADFSIYEKSIKKSFELFLGDPSEYVYLGLLPSYLERSNSSLIHMVNHLMKLSNKKENGYFLYNFEQLNKEIKQLEKNKKKAILFGVSYALLDFAHQYPQELQNTIVIETGGMKGRKKEIMKEELLSDLQKTFQTQFIYSEYSMTELLSQAYSLGNNKYSCPPWMKVLIRDTEDPKTIMENGKNGRIQIIDLANIHSCSFISTEDLGKSANSYFEIMGRLDHSDIRGCSLLLL